MSAVLGTGYAPVDLSMGLFQTANPAFSTAIELRKLQSRGLLSSPCSAPTDPATKTLDTLLIRLRPLLLAASILENENTEVKKIRDLRQGVRLLNSEFALWPLSQTKHWKFQTIGRFECDLSMDTVDGLDMFPGRVDTYFDRKCLSTRDLLS